MEVLTVLNMVKKNKNNFGNCIFIMYSRIAGDHMLFYMVRMIGSGFTIFATVPVLIAAWKNRKPNLLSPWLVIKFLSLVTAVIYWFYLGILAILANAVYYGTSFILGACIGGGKIL
jgi:NhaP-type Na+/H+ or K+/H+ antiporter